MSAHPHPLGYFTASAKGPCMFLPNLTAMNLSLALLIRLTTADNKYCCLLHRHPEQNVSVGSFPKHNVLKPTTKYTFPSQDVSLSHFLKINDRI